MRPNLILSLAIGILVSGCATRASLRSSGDTDRFFLTDTAAPSESLPSLEKQLGRQATFNGHDVIVFPVTGSLLEKRARRQAFQNSLSEARFQQKLNEERSRFLERQTCFVVALSDKRATESDFSQWSIDLIDSKGRQQALTFLNVNFSEGESSYFLQSLDVDRRTAKRFRKFNLLALACTATRVLLEDGFTLYLEDRANIGVADKILTWSTEPMPPSL